MIGTSHTEAVETAVKTSSKRTSRKSSTFMSAYDKQVEERLKKLESSSSSSGGDVEERLSKLESRLDNLLTILKMDKTLNIPKLSVKYPVD